MKKELILASHGKLAEGMRNTLEMIIGDIPISCTTYCLFPGHHPDEFEKEIEQRVKMNSTTEFNIIADLYGASVCTSLSRLSQYTNVHLFSGMNLNLVLSLTLEYPEMLTEKDLDEIIDRAKHGINIVRLKDDQDGNEF